MKTRRYILAVGLLLLLAGCFKDVSYKTSLIFRPIRQQTSGSQYLPFEGLQAFAYNVDTTQWMVASYEDAIAGVITSKNDPAQRLTTPVATSSAYEQEGAAGWVQLPLTKPSQMVVAVDTEDRLYAYTQWELEVNSPKLYVTLPFRVWKEGFVYKDGSWVYRNDFYEPPKELECTVSPRQQAVDGGDQTTLSSAEVYAFAADTTEWYIASYADAVGRIITSKLDPKQTLTAPEMIAYADKTTGNYTMSVKYTTLMLVVADKSTGSSRYAYSKQVVDLDGPSRNFPVLFQPWRNRYIYVEETTGWRVVDEALKPKDSTTTPSKFSNR